MSLVSTLAKVAIGVALAKGVSQLSKTSQTGRGTAASQTGTAPGGLGDMMGQILGGKTTGQGGLGGLLDQFSGQSNARRPTARKAAPSGIEGMLGGLTGGTGGIGDMLGGLLGGGAAAGGGLGGLGGMLSDVMAGRQPQTAPNAQQELAAAVMLRAMVQAVKADGKLDPAEKKKLMDSLGDADPKEVALVNDLLSQPVDIDALVEQVPQGLEEQAYLMSLMAIDLDTSAEADYLHGLAQALGLDRTMVNDIHQQAGAPALYS